MIGFRWFLGVAGVLLTVAGVGLAWVLRELFNTTQLYSVELGLFAAAMAILLAGLVWPQQRALLNLGAVISVAGLIASCWTALGDTWALRLYLLLWLVYFYLGARIVA